MKINALKLLPILLLSTNAFAQQEHIDTNVFNRIKTAELQNSHVAQIAHYLTDVAGPRLTGSRGFMTAANWAIAAMKGWGMENATLEPWGDFGKQWELNDFNLFLRSPYAQPLKAYPQPWSTATPGTIKGGVVILTQRQMIDSAYLAQHRSEIEGKFILTVGDTVNTADNFKPTSTRYADTALANMKDVDMIAPGEAALYRQYEAKSSGFQRLLKSSGALATISTSKTDINGQVFVQWFDGYRIPDGQSIPHISMALEDANRLKRLIASGQKVELSLNLQSSTLKQNVKGYNVIAEIPGTDPNLKSEVVMLGGHLDSWDASTGATDNGAGCIVMMEAVRLLDSLHLHPKRTIRIALWSGEEQGLLGSYGYAKIHFMDPKTFEVKPEQSKVSVYFNLDNGSGKIRGIFAQNNKAAKDIFEQWFKPFHNMDATTVTMSNTGSTDHLSFDWAGIPGFQFIQDPIDYDTHTHHTNLDDYDHLIMDDMKQAAIIVASFVYQASARADMMPRKKLVKERFTFDGL